MNALSAISVSGWSEFLIGAPVAGESGFGAPIDAVPAVEAVGVVGLLPHPAAATRAANTISRHARLHIITSARPDTASAVDREYASSERWSQDTRDRSVTWSARQRQEQYQRILRSSIDLFTK